MQLRAFNGLNEKIIKDIKQLVTTCEKKDKITSKIYWAMISRQRRIPGDYCLYHGDKLIAYLSTFYFEENTIEITALVHPDYRRQSIFTELYNFAKDKLRDIEHQYFVFACPADNVGIKKYLQNFGAKLAYKEYTLSRQHKGFIEFSPRYNLQLEKAQVEDIAILAEIDQSCFHSNFQDMFTRFIDTIDEAERDVWLVKLGDAYIGKAHVRQENEHTLLHDLCVIPEYQDQGYAHQLLTQIVNILYMRGHKNLYAEIQTGSTKALQLFSNCGFDITRVDEFWRFNAHHNKQLYQPYQYVTEDLH